MRTTRDDLDEALREASYYAGLTHSCGWPALDEVTGGVAPGGLWTIACPIPHARRFATSQIAASLAGSGDRTVFVSTVATAATALLEIVGPPCGVNPTALAIERDRISALSRWVLDDRWPLLDLDAYGADDDLSPALATSGRPVHSLIIDRADLLTGDQLAQLLGGLGHQPTGHGAQSDLMRLARRRRMRVVLSQTDSPASLQRERDDVLLAIGDGQHTSDWTVELEASGGLSASFDVVDHGLRWTARLRHLTGEPALRLPAVTSALSHRVVENVRRPHRDDPLK